MRRARRGRKRTGSTHLSISATNAEWRALLVAAEAAGLSRPRFVRMLVEQDTAVDGGGFSALSPDEQREMLETVRRLRALAQAPPPPATKRRPKAAAAAPPGPDDRKPVQGRLL